MITFDLPKNQSSIIKVVGVGGGGSNAVSHMFNQGIRGVDFFVCNTDAQAMEISPVPSKIQLGKKGLGAGSIPSVGKESAMENLDDIRSILEKNTKMLFITAGMGGGTGTGAAPVIASVAKELGILTVGIVTIPFSFEGRKRRIQANQGIEDLRRQLAAHIGLRSVDISVQEVKQAELNATLVAESIARQLERRSSFKRAMKRAAQTTMRSGAKGIKIRCAGRLNGAEIARAEWTRMGSVPLHTLRSDIDYGFAEANTTYGIIGVKVWICRGEYRHIRK